MLSQTRDQLHTMLRRTLHNTKGIVTSMLSAACVVTLLCASPIVQGQVSHSQKPQKQQRAYDGNWWTSADREEQSGFMQGIRDCLTWTAHVPGFSYTPEQLQDRISRYYREHPKERQVSVVDVWRKLVAAEPPAQPPKGGETWSNPHWYLNGLWWSGESERARLGFLEGYLWCVQTCVPSPSESYTKPIPHYIKQIDSYLRTHPKGDDEAVADILCRFADKRSDAPPL